MAEPLKDTSLVFDESQNRIKVEFLPRPAVAPDYEHNHAQEIALVRFRRFMENIIGTVRSNGLGISYAGGNYTISAGTIFHKEFKVTFSSPTVIPDPGASRKVYIHLTIVRSGSTVEVPGGPNLNGPNYYSFTATIETGISVPSDDASNVYIELGTLHDTVAGSYVESTPLLNAKISEVVSDEYWEAIQLFKDNLPITVPKVLADPNPPDNFEVVSIQKVRMNYGEERNRYRVWWTYPALVNDDEIAFFQFIVFQINAVSATVSTEWILTIPASKNRSYYYADIIPTVNTHSYVVHCAVRSVTRSGRWSDWLVLGKDRNNHRFSSSYAMNDNADAFMGHVFVSQVVAMTERPVEPGLWFYAAGAGQWQRYELDGGVPDPPVSRRPEEMMAVAEGGVDFENTLAEIQLVNTQIASKNREIATAILEGDSQSKLMLEEEKAELQSQLVQLEENVKTALSSVQYSSFENIRSRIEVIDSKIANRLALMNEELATVGEVVELSREIPISFGKFTITSGQGAIVDKIPLDPGRIVKASLLVSSVSAAGKVRFYAEGQEADYKSIEVSTTGLIQGNLDLQIGSPFVLVVDVVDGNYQNTITMTATLTFYYVKTK